ncbi:NlpC/P60 family protein [Hominifimenecus sp. rT4P-3]|uniref:C40 family peptidase n=1 Tax=Hominifimenecus sp. rT4P-3 TaxID=3242979 RepID=UPI003DA541C9
MSDWMRRWGLTGFCAMLVMAMGPSAAFAAPEDEELEVIGAAAVPRASYSRTIAPVGAAVSFSKIDRVALPEREVDEHASVKAYEERKAEVEEAYKNVAISQVENYVNIRKDANTEAEVLGKIYNNAAATIEETVEKEDGTWYKVKSGSVEGFIKAEYFATGAEAEALAKQVGRVSGTVTTETLRLREEPSLDSATLTLLSADEKYAITEETGNFVKLSIDTDLAGYVCKDYVEVHIDFDQAISLEEERAEQERLERLRREAEEEQERLRKEKESESRAKASSKAAKKTTEAKETTKKKKPSSSTEKKETTKKQEAPSSDGSVSSTRKAIVAYAESFVGNLDYVYGGNSLSSGVDCSGFVQQIYSKYGVSLPRSSGDQAGAGHSVSSSDMKPGDIIYYGGHVAIYIGDGCVVHASSPETGIKISSWNYRTPKSIRNVLD